MAKLADALDLGSSGQPYGFKSLQLHQKMAMSMWHKPFFLYTPLNKGLERVGIADTRVDCCCLSATNDGHPSFATPA